MSRKIKLGDKLYDVSSLDPKGLEILGALEQANARIAELTKLHSALGRAREGYMNDLKREVIKGRTGVDIASILSD